MIKSTPVLEGPLRCSRDSLWKAERGTVVSEWGRYCLIDAVFDVSVSLSVPLSVEVSSLLFPYLLIRSQITVFLITRNLAHSSHHHQYSIHHFTTSTAHPLTPLLLTSPPHLSSILCLHLLCPLSSSSLPSSALLSAVSPSLLPFTLTCSLLSPYVPSPLLLCSALLCL